MQIRNFELRYDSMFHITWFDGNEEHKWYVHIPISQLLSMLEIEGITMDDIKLSERSPKPLKFEKVILTCEYDEDQDVFEAYGFFDEFYGNTLKSKFKVELFYNDSIENHKGETIVGAVYLANEKIT